MIDSERKRDVIKQSLTLLVGCCIFAYLGMFFILNVCGFERFSTADVYTDTLIAKKMWEGKTLFPDGFIWGNQYYVIATPALAALFYGVTGNTNTAMICATFAMIVLMIASFLWLLRPITKDVLYSLMGVLLLLASVVAPDGPCSPSPEYFYVEASYYSCYLITMFVVFGDYFRTFHSCKLRIAALTLSLILSFATGMQSLRQTAIMIAPLFGCEIYLAFRRLLHWEKPWEREDLGRLLRITGYGIANVIGYVTVKLMHIPYNTNYGTMQFSSFSLWDKLSGVMSSIREISCFNFILNQDYPPAIRIYITFLLVVFVAAFVIWLSRIRQQASILDLCWLLFLMSILCVLLSYLLMDIALRSAYIFMWFPLLVFSGLIFLQKVSFGPRCIAIILACVLSLGNLYYGYFPYAAMAIWRGPTDQQQMCQWLMENDYTYAYGNYWDGAPPVAVYSGGKIEAGYWFPTSSMYQARDILILRDIYGAEENEKAVYIFTSEDEEQGVRTALDRGITITKVAEFGDYKAYTSPVPLMSPPDFP